MSRSATLADRFARSSPSLSVSVVMPVFNEAATFAATLTELLASLEGIEFLSTFEVIIVESNSTDGSHELARGFADHPGCVVLLQDRPRGKGNAVRTGLESAQGDVVIIYDADDEYEASDVRGLLAPILEGRTSFVLGSRHSGTWTMRQYENGRITQYLMNAGHLIFTTSFNVVNGVHLADPFTMFKVFRREAIEGLTFHADRFDFDFELAQKLIRVGCVPLEVPVAYTSRGFNDGKKVRFFRDPFTWVVALFRFRVDPLYAGDRPPSR